MILHGAVYVKDDGVRSNLLFVMLVEVMSFLLRRLL